MLLQLSISTTRVRARRDMSQHHGNLQTSPKPAAEGGKAIITLRSVVGVVRAWLGTRNTERGTIWRVLCSSFSHTPTAAGTCLIWRSSPSSRVATTPGLGAVLYACLPQPSLLGLPLCSPTQWTFSITGPHREPGVYWLRGIRSLLSLGGLCERGCGCLTAA